MKGSLWLSPQEVGALTARFGSVGKGLRHLVNQWVAGEPKRKKGVDPVEHVAQVYGVPVDIITDVGGMTVVSQETGRPIQVLGRQGGKTAAMDEAVAQFEAANPDAVVAKTHRHRRGAVIRVDYEYGTPKNVYACAQCGEELA